MGFTRRKDRTPDRNELLDTWEKRDYQRFKKIQMHRAGYKLVDKKMKTERCVACGNYDLTLPLSFYFCDLCAERAFGYIKEKAFSARKTITMKPCFICGRTSGFLSLANAYVCGKCMHAISKNAKKGVGYGNTRFHIQRK